MHPDQLICFFFLSIKKSVIGAMNPNISATKIVATRLPDSDSNVKAKIVKIIIVNEGGTNSVEMNLANLCGVKKFNITVST